MKKYTFLIIIFLIFLFFIRFIFINRYLFTRRYDETYFTHLYSRSQYVLGNGSENPIGDDALYAFAGYNYFFQNGDVSAVNFEHPPLGKYLIGLSIFLFGNENAINIVYYIILLITVFNLGKIILKDNLLSLVAVGVLAIDPLFLDHSVRSMLDLPFAMFFILGVYFTLLSFDSSKNIYLSNLFWGAAFSTRFFPFFMIVSLYFLLFIFLRYRILFIHYLVSLTFVPAIYLLCHISFFMYHPSIIEFLRHKKWMLAWFSGTPVIIGNIWRNIFTGSYYDSVLNLTKNSLWSISVPIVTLTALLKVEKNILSEENGKHLFLWGFCLLYLLYLTFLTNGLLKFYMPIYPLMVVLSIDHISGIYNIILAWKKKT